MDEVRLNPVRFLAGMLVASIGLAAAAPPMCRSLGIPEPFRNA
jgi:hypothetical protein